MTYYVMDHPRWGWSCQISLRSESAGIGMPFLVGLLRVEHLLAPGATVQMKAGIEIPVGMKAGTYNLIAAAGPGARGEMVVFGSQAKGLVVG